MDDFVKAVLDFESRLSEIGYRDPTHILLTPRDYGRFVTDMFSRRAFRLDLAKPLLPSDRYSIYTPNGPTQIDIQPMSPKDAMMHYAKGKCRHEIPLGYCNECFP